MCFLISIFLCFALVPKLVPRTVDFHWYWYRILKFWYRDNPNLIYEGDISPAKINMWKENMAVDEIKLIEDTCWPVMERLGYKRHTVSHSFL